MIEVMLGVLLGFLGTYVMQRQRDGIERKTRREGNTLELAKEFESEQMIRARCLADLHFVPRDGADPAQRLRDLYENDVERVIPIFQILHFYEKLSMLKRHGHIDEAMAIDIFGENYSYWHSKYLARQAELDDKWKEWYLAGAWLLPTQKTVHVGRIVGVPAGIPAGVPEQPESALDIARIAATQ